jgi:hypothetical protein
LAEVDSDLRRELGRILSVAGQASAVIPMDRKWQDKEFAFELQGRTDALLAPIG